MIYRIEFANLAIADSDAQSVRHERALIIRGALKLILASSRPLIQSIGPSLYTWELKELLLADGIESENCSMEASSHS